MFVHRKLKIYQQSIRFLGTVTRILDSLPTGYADLVNQFRRASYSIALNTAEGAGRTSSKDKKRFYSIARGSALECAAIIDVLRAYNLGNKEQLKIAEKQLEGIVAMLSRLVFQ